MLSLYLGDNILTIGIFLLIAIVHIVQTYVINAIVPVQPRTITCWRCQNKTDNNQCNYWTQQHRCPTNYSVCQTIHRINVETGQTLHLSKRCALSSECTIDVIGCHYTHINGIQDCISCCNYAYCNKLVPSNYSSALMYSVVPSRASSLSAMCSYTALFFIVLRGIIYSYYQHLPFINDMVITKR